MRVTVGKKIGAAFAVVLLILLVIGFVSYRGTVKLIETSEKVAHTHKVLGELFKLLTALIDAETGQRGFLLTGKDSYLQPYQQALAKIDKATRALRALTVDNDRQQRRQDAVEPLIKNELNILKEQIDLRRDKSAEVAADVLHKGKGKEIMDTLRTEIAEMEREERSLLKARDGEVRDSEQGVYWTLGLGTGLAVLFVGVGGFFMIRSITAPVRQVVSQLATASAEIQATTTQQAAGAQEQAAAVAQTVTTVDEVTQTADQAAQRARGVGEAVQRTLEVGKAGRQAMDDSRAAMAQVKEQVEATAEGILALAEQAQAIGEIIATVNDIAEQTNLLALNAAIEASRAGEHGRGFAVVAGEVKALADQSKKATGQVRQILGEIQKATAQAVRATEDVTRGVAGAVKVGEQAGETIKALAEALADAARAAAQIAASVGQQATGMTQIHQAMRNIDQVAKQNAAATRQAAQAAESLNTLGTRLNGLLAE